MIRRSTGCGPPVAPVDRQPGGARVDAVLATDARERRPVRRLVVDLQRLVDVLMRDLVLEHLADEPPGMAEHQPAGQRDGPLQAIPAPEAMRSVRQSQDGRAQGTAEVGLGDLAPGEGQLAEQGGLQEDLIARRAGGHVFPYTRSGGRRSQNGGNPAIVEVYVD